MSEARDRLPRPVDVAAVFARRRAGILGIIDESVTAGSDLFGTPRAQRATLSTTLGLGATRTGTIGRGSFGNLLTRNVNGTLSVGMENMPVGIARRRRGRATDSVLPYWYPRRPLGDITVVLRAIERRRARLRDEGSQIDTLAPRDEAVTDPLLSASVAQLERDTPLKTPSSFVKTKHCPPSVGEVPKILLGITNQNNGEDCLTPQKKLLNSIDTVEKAVMEELQKLKRTPTAKKAERQKRVRTLMSMR